VTITPRRHAVQLKLVDSKYYRLIINCINVHLLRNVSEALVSRGLSTVARHRQDDDKRARDYDTLLSAEAKAEKDKLRIHAVRAGVALDKPATVRVQDLQGVCVVL
jgi:hypothetical protein